MKRYRLYAIGGMIAPIIGLITIALLGWLIEGYSHKSDMISKIIAKGSQYALPGTFIIILTGILLLLFVKGLYMKLPKNNYTKVFVALISFFAIFACIGSAAFPCEISDNKSLNCPTKTHEIINGLALGALSLSPIMFILATKGSAPWKNLKSITYAAQILGLIFLALFIIYPDELTGLFQRITLGIYFIWFETLAIRLYNIAKLP